MSGVSDQWATDVGKFIIKCDRCVFDQENWCGTIDNQLWLIRQWCIRPKTTKHEYCWSYVTDQQWFTQPMNNRYGAIGHQLWLRWSGISDKWTTDVWSIWPTIWGWQNIYGRWSSTVTDSDLCLMWGSGVSDQRTSDVGQLIFSYDWHKLCIWPMSNTAGKLSINCGWLGEVHPTRNQAKWDNFGNL